MAAPLLADPMSALIARAVAEKERLTQEVSGASAAAQQPGPALDMSGMNVPPETDGLSQFIQSLSSGVASAISGNRSFAQNTAATQENEKARRDQSLKQLNELRATELLAQKRQLHETRIQDLQNKYDLLKEAGRSEDALKVLEQQIASHKELEKIRSENDMARSRFEQGQATARNAADIASRERTAGADRVSNEKIRLKEEYYKALTGISDQASEIRSRGFRAAADLKDKKEQAKEILATVKKEEEFLRLQSSKTLPGEEAESYLGRLASAYPGWDTDEATLRSVYDQYLKNFPDDEAAKADYKDRLEKLRKKNAPETKTSKKGVSLRLRAPEDVRKARREHASELLNRFFGR